MKPTSKLFIEPILTNRQIPFIKSALKTLKRPLSTLSVDSDCWHSTVIFSLVVISKWGKTCSSSTESFSERSFLLCEWVFAYRAIFWVLKISQWKTNWSFSFHNYCCLRVDHSWSQIITVYQFWLSYESFRNSWIFEIILLGHA